MTHPRRRSFRPRKTGRKGTFRKKSRPPHLKPGADADLKKKFEAIGRPTPKPFHPDPFQMEAVAAIAVSDCLVTAPTGAGKTWIAVQAIRRVFENGGRSWYGSPLKALTNAKYQEFGQIFGPESVGILTGDRKENPAAPIITGTTEILRNQLYDAMHRGEALDADFVVLDEAHFLGDAERGVVWEEIMIYLPAHTPLLLLSATVGNAGQIAEWLTRIRNRDCQVVAETRRPVPLEHLFLHPDGTLLPLVQTVGKSGKTRIHRKVSKYLKEKPQRYLAPPHLLPPFDQILALLARYRLQPAIFFLKSRADCDKALGLCERKPPLDREHRQKLHRRIDELLADHARLAQHGQLDRLRRLAVGAHHSGQLPAWKLLLETLMTEGLLQAVFATSTVAAGVNFPARTISFLNSDRFNGREFLPLSSTEFHQMTGRAGRRGMDRIGFSMVLPGKYMDARLAARLVSAAPSPVQSQIRINFSMVLNLLLSHTPEDVRGMLKKSLAAFQQTNSSANSTRQLVDDFNRHLKFLQDSGYVHASGMPTEDGLWAAQLRIDQPLLVAECFREGLFPGDDPALMAGLMAPFVYERENAEAVSYQLVSRELMNRLKKIQKKLAPFARNMAKQGFFVRNLQLRPAAVLFSWTSGIPWEGLVKYIEMAEGDLAMLVLRTADNLRHICALGDQFPAQAATAAEALDRMRREPVFDET